MLTVTREGNVVTVTESLMLPSGNMSKTVIYNLDTREMLIGREEPRTMSDADVRRIKYLCERRALTGNGGLQYPLKPTHIRDIKRGDVVYCADGDYRTVGKNDIKRSLDNDVTLFGDSYHNGNKMVMLALTDKAIRVASPAVEQRNTVRLADGYNGDSKLFYTDPIAVDGDLVKLQCAEPGQGHLIRWARRSEVQGDK